MTAIRTGATEPVSESASSCADRHPYLTATGHLVYVPTTMAPMPTFPPTPLFHGRPVIVDYHPAIRDARVVHASIVGLTARLQDRHATEDELIAAIPPRVAEYGYTARLVARTREAIEFAVTRQEVCPSKFRTICDGEASSRVRRVTRRLRLPASSLQSTEPHSTPRFHQPRWSGS